VLQRLGDRRVRQYWDPNHSVAAVLKRSAGTGKLHPTCCERKGILWDLTAAYAPGPLTLWRDTLPAPLLIDGTVVRTGPALEAIVMKGQ